MENQKDSTNKELQSLADLAGLPPDSKAYRALALFLVFTTNPGFFDPAGTRDVIIANRLQIDVNVVSVFRKTVLNGVNLTYDDVRKQFLTMAKAAGYSGAQCPSSFQALGAIGDLYQ